MYIGVENKREKIYTGTQYSLDMAILYCLPDAVPELTSAFAGLLLNSCWKALEEHVKGCVGV